ncbi:MAG TPA: DUF2058 domain-containing protein [Immundisolibacter sp.]
MLAGERSWCKRGRHPLDDNRLECLPVAGDSPGRYPTKHQRSARIMVNLLQAQLLKAGLVKPEQIQKVEQQKRAAARRGEKPPSAPPQTSVAQQKADADRQRNRQQQEQRERKAQAAEIRQLIEAHRLDRRGGESAYQFVDGGKIRKLPLHEAQRQQLVQGALAVVRLGGGFELVPPAIAGKIAQRDAGRVVDLNTRTPQPADPASDPYADYPVPDDLMW